MVNGVIMKIKGLLRIGKKQLVTGIILTKTVPCLAIQFIDDYLFNKSGAMVETSWVKIDETHTAVRFVTSFATKHENIEYLLTKIQLRNRNYIFFIRELK